MPDFVAAKASPGRPSAFRTAVARKRLTAMAFKRAARPGCVPGTDRSKIQIKASSFFRPRIVPGIKKADRLVIARMNHGLHLQVINI
jgi:hypothetical protein